MAGLDVKSTQHRGQPREEFEGAVSRNLESALKDAMDLSNADYDTLEDIADGLERMLHSWNDVQEQRAHEYARLRDSLAKDKSQGHKGTADMKEALQDIGIRVSHDSSGKDDGFVSPLKYPGSPKGSHSDGAVRENDPAQDEKWLPEWAALLNKSEPMDLSDRVSSKRKVGIKNLFGVRAMPLKKKPRKQVITVQIDDKRDKGGECTCDEAETTPRGGSNPSSQRKRWPAPRPRASPLNFIKGKDSPSQLRKQIEELQIALLESATEYELKILQMKMQMLQNKNEAPPKQQQQHPPGEEEGEVHAVDCTRKQVCRLQKEKKDLTHEVYELRKRERMFEQQRKVLEDAQYRVNCLKRELMKKEGQLVNAQLREKAANAKVSQLEDILNRSEDKLDTARLWNVLPKLHEWLQSIRKESSTRLDQAQISQFQHYETQISKILERLPNKPDHVASSLPFYKMCTHGPPPQPQPREKPKKKPPFDRCAKPNLEAKKEAQALQRELHKLAHPKQSNSKQVSKGGPSTTQQQQKQQQQQQPYWLYGAALLLGGLLFKNRCVGGG